MSTRFHRKVAGDRECGKPNTGSKIICSEVLHITSVRISVVKARHMATVEFRGVDRYT